MDAHAEPQRVPGERRYRSVSVHETVCAVDVEGKAWCWGDDGWGETGSGPNDSSCRSALAVEACAPEPRAVLPVAR